MAATVHVAGACLCQIATPYTGSLVTLGYTRNMADVTKEAFFLNVPGDENGGDDGPPIEVLYLGEIARIRLELTKWDELIANAIRARVAGGTAGTASTPGTMMSSADKMIRVLLKSANIPRNFPFVLPRNAIEIGRGTKYSSLILELEAHKIPATSILYNEVIT